MYDRPYQGNKRSLLDYYLNARHKQYDAIILDAFLGDSSPSHLLTRQAFTEMQRILAPIGTLVINSFVDFEPGRDFFGGFPG